MQKFIFRTLSSAITAILTSPFVCASQLPTFDPQITLSYKNFYWEEKDKARTAPLSETYRDEWVHGVVVKLDTGYVNDIFGAVVTAGFADPLSAGSDDIHGSKGIFLSNVAQNSHGKAVGIAGVQEAYLKGKFQYQNIALNGNVGVKQRTFELYNNSTSRLLAASSNGIDVTATMGEATFYASRITGASDRNASTFTEDLTINGQKLDYIQILGANYNLGGMELTAEQLESHNYLKKHFAKAAYTIAIDEGLSLDTDVRYGRAKRDGTLMANQQYKSSYINLNARLNIDNAFIGFGYNKTKDGDWIAASADQGNNEVFNSSLSQWDDYAKEGEKAYVVSVGYNFADQGLPGLNIETLYAKGKDAKNYKSDFDRHEYTTAVSYAFDGQLDGLSVAWVNVNYDFTGTQLNSNIQEKQQQRINRFYLNYTMSVF